MGVDAWLFDKDKRRYLDVGRAYHIGRDGAGHRSAIAGCAFGCTSAWDEAGICYGCLMRIISAEVRVTVTQFVKAMDGMTHRFFAAHDQDAVHMYDVRDRYGATEWKPKDGAA